jgi:hypothetical protein
MTTPNLIGDAAKLAILKADILSKPELSGQFAEEIARYYNQRSSPDFVVWKSRVTLDEMGSLISKNDLGNITTSNLDRLKSFYTISIGGTNPSLADHRAFWDNTFSGAAGAATRANYGAIGGFKRYATRCEKLFATGTGSLADPAVMSVEGALTYQEVEAAQRA